MTECRTYVKGYLLLSVILVVCLAGLFHAFADDGNILRRTNKADDTCGGPDNACHNVKVHNSANTGSGKWSEAGGWGVEGGKYGKFVCQTCHTPHNTKNIFLIKEKISFPDGSVMPSGQVESPVDYRYKSADVGAPEADFAKGNDHVSASGRTAGNGQPTTTTRPCEVCHSQTKYHRYNTANQPGGYDHNNAKDCVMCHNHQNGFAHAFGAGGGKLEVCIQCHGHDPGYTFTYNSATIVSEGRGNYRVHSTHTENDADDLRGPNVFCTTCHNPDNMPTFASGTDLNNDGLFSLSETDVCDQCHSPTGFYNGVNSDANGSAGVKENFKATDGDYARGGVYSTLSTYTTYTGSQGLTPVIVYDTDGTLKAGKEKWCVGCHDDAPPTINGKTAPAITGDSSTYGFFFNGHGKPSSGNYNRLSWQDTSAVGNPGAERICDECHDTKYGHIGNSSTGDPRNKRLKWWDTTEYNNKTCKQCHDDANADAVAKAAPQWFTTYSAFEGSAHNSRTMPDGAKVTCTSCHEPHGMGGANNPAMTKGLRESLCYNCHTDGKVVNNAISGASTAASIQGAFNLAGTKHPVSEYKAFQKDGLTYNLTCISCHNVHLVTGKYWDAAQGQSPLTRFSDKTSVWGDETGEKMSDFIGSGTYEVPLYDVELGANFRPHVMPDYPSFCLDCHSSFGGSGYETSGIDWDSNPHGRATAGTPSAYGGHNYWSVGMQGFDTFSPGYKAKRGRGGRDYNYGPWDPERRYAQANFTLACVNCHEVHGSGYDRMIRPELKQQGTVCQNCHFAKSEIMNGGLFGCGSASCHQNDNIHRLAVGATSSAGTKVVFDREHVADLRFESAYGEASFPDATTSFSNARLLNMSSKPITSDPATTGLCFAGGWDCGQCDWLTTLSDAQSRVVPGKVGNAVQLDGEQCVEVGTESCYASSGTARQTAAAYEWLKTGTVEAWIYPTELTGARYVVASNEREGSKNWSIEITNDPSDSVYGGSASFTDYRLVFRSHLMGFIPSTRAVYSSIPVPVNQWTHVAAVYDADAPDGKGAKLYMNGKEVTAPATYVNSTIWSQPPKGEELSPGTYFNSSSQQPLMIGCDPGIIDNQVNNTAYDVRPFTGFKGLIDEFNVYSIARTAQQIEADYGAPRIESAVGSIGGSQVTVTFSEGVYTSTGSSGALTAADFAVADSDNGRTVVSVSHTAGSATAVLILSSALDSSDDINVDTVSAANDASIYDGADLAMAARGRTITGPTSFKSIIARDTNGAPGIQAGDTVTLKFIEATQGNSVTGAIINAALGLSSGTWLDGLGNLASTPQWSSILNTYDTLTVTLSASGSPPTVAPGTVVTPDGTIKSAGGTPITTPHVVAGTFDPLPDGAVGYWNFDESRDLTAYDSTAYENHGTLQNGASWIAGRSGGAVSLDGVDDYVEVPDSNSLDLTTKGTIELWAKKDSNKPYQAYVAKYATSGDPAQFYGFMLGDADGQIFVRWGRPQISERGSCDDDYCDPEVRGAAYRTYKAGSLEALVTDCDTAPTGQWNHILLTYDGSVMKVFLNGRLLKTGAYVKEAVANAYPLRIGAAGSGAGDYEYPLDGAVDNVVVYNRALSNDEARERYGEPVRPNGALAYDTMGAEGIQDGDRVVVKFDGPTNGAVTAANIGTVLSLSNGHSWGMAQSATWSTSVYTNDTLTVTLTSAATIDRGDTVTTDGTVLKDLKGNSISATMGVSGRFGPLPSGAVAYYDFNEGSGTVVHDQTPNGFDGIVYGGGSWIPGRDGSGYALDLNGTNAYVRVTECGDTPLDLTTAATFEFWMRKDSSPVNTYPALVTKGQSPVSDSSTGRWQTEDTLGYKFYASTNEARLTLVWGGGGGSSYGTSNSYLSLDGGWKHVVATYDGDVRFYVDGEYVGGGHPGNNGLASNDPVLFGAYPYFDGLYAPYFLDGAIDEAIIYNRALSANEVRENSGIPWQIKSAVASDMGGAGGVQTGDRVVITFNGPTQATPITAANIDAALALPPGKTWKSGGNTIGNALWSTARFSNDTLTVILSDAGGAPNVAVGDTITLDGATIKDHLGRPVPAGTATLAGSFGPLSGDIVGYWNFAEGSGSIASDSSSFANHGVLMGDAGWTAGQTDPALRLDGTGGYVKVNDSNSLDIATRDLYGVRIATTTTGWAVGHSGAMFQFLENSNYNTGYWVGSYYSPTTNHLYSVDMGAATDFFAVGASGTILRNNGGYSYGWAAMASPVTADLYSMDMLSSTSGWAVGKNNTIIRWNGTAWSAAAITSPTAAWSLKSVKMLSSTEGWAVGGDNVTTAVILRWDGASWTEFYTTTAVNMLNGIDMLSSTEGWAVGPGGLILMFDGTNWTEMTSPTVYELNAVKAFSATEAWAVGANRTILMFDGASWTVNSEILGGSGTPTLRAIDSVPALPSDDTSTVDFTKYDYVAGDSSALLKHSDGVYLSGGSAGQRILSWGDQGLEGFGEATFVVWAKKNSNKSDQTYLAKEYPSQSIDMIAYRIKEYGTTGKPAFTWNSWSNTPGETVCSEAAPVGQWYNVIVTVSARVGTQRIYLDGQYCGQKTSGTGPGYNSAYPLVLGTGYYGGADFDGDIDQITIYNRAFSADEVWENYGSRPVTFKAAVADDSSNGGYGVQAGDRVTITFDGPTRGDAVNSANIDTVLNAAGKTWLSGNGSLASAVWSTTTWTNDTLTLTLSDSGGAPTVAENDVITLGAGLYDKLDRAMTGSAAISGSFGSDTRLWTLDWLADWQSGALASTTPTSGDSAELSKWDALTYDLWSVDMLSATEGWAVGERGAIRRYDGTAWKSVFSPLSPNSYTGSLYSVDMVSSADGWAVGSSGKILRYDGTKWDEAASPVTTNLLAVRMLSATEGWAAGASGKILKWDGANWTSVTSPTTGSIYAIDAVSSAEVWVAGGLSTNTYRWDGSSWTTVALPVSSTIRSIHMLSSSDGWAVGDGGKIFRYNGSSWAAATSPTTYNLYSVRMVSPTDGWAFGGTGYVSGLGTGVVLRWDGSNWSLFSSHAGPGYFYGAAMLSATDGWAAGIDGAIFRWNGASWSEYTAAYSYQYINDVQFVSDTDGWAVGGGKALRYNGSTWNTFANLTNKTFADIDMLSANEGWIAGPSDYFWRYLNGSWTSFANPSGQWLEGIDMLSSTEGWAVGGGGTILKWDGASWSAAASPTANSLWSIDMLSSTEGWAVGYSGVILKWDGTSWTTVASPTTGTLYAIEMLSSTEGWAAGMEAASPFNGIILKYDGASWTQVSISTAAKNLLDIRMRSSIEGMAVGSGGAVLTYDGTSWKYSETPGQASDSYSNYVAAYTPSGTPWVAGYAKFVKGGGYASYGTVTHTKDAGWTVDWLSQTYEDTAPASTSVSFRWATSNDGSTWSAWTNNFATLADSRYLKQEAALSTTDPSATPSIDKTTVEYKTGLIAGAIAYWDFDAGTGTTVEDATSNNNDITWMTNPGADYPTWVSGQKGNALYFDGTSDRAYLAYNSSQNLGANDFTIETWLKFPSQVDGDTGGAGGAPISQRWSTSTGYEVLAGYPTPGKVRFKVGSEYVDTASDGLNDNTWRHYVFLREGTQLKVYVNGVLDNTAAASAGVSVDTGRGISIGYARVWPDDYYSNWYTGAIDRTILYNRALTGTEAAQRAGFTVPSAPTMDAPQALSTTSIRWNFTDTATDEQGFRLHDSGHAVIASAATPDLAYLDETGLSADTWYVRHVHAYNGSMESAASNARSAYTLSNDPATATATDWTYTDRITVAWTSGGAESGFRVYRDGDKTAGTQVYDGTGATFDDMTTGAHAYYVYSKNGDGVLSAGYATDSGTAGVPPPPAAPTIGAPAVLSSASVRWNFADNSNDELGFRLHDSAHAVKASSATPNLTYLDETGLSPNTLYTRHVHAYNNGGDSAASLDASARTFALAPNVSSDKTASVWYNTPTVVFTNDAGFGAGGVEYYRYVWDQNPAYAFDNTETQWTVGTLARTSTADGDWHLHVKSYNADDIAAGTADYGPFRYDSTPPAGLANLSPADGAAQQALTTAVSASAATDSGIGGVQYYFEAALDAGFTAGVQSSGWQAGTSFSPALTGGATYYWHVKARDGLSNETAYTAARSFATLSPPAAPTVSAATVLSTTSIRWNFIDAASNEEGFRLHDAAHALKASSAAQNLTYLDETGLSPDTLYTRHVHAYNAAGESAASADASRYTLSSDPTGADASDGTYPDRIRVAWTSGGAQSGYIVYRDGDKDAGTAVYDGAAAAFDDFITGVHSYYVYSKNGEGALSAGYSTNGGFTSGISDTTPPAQVTGLTATGASSTSIDLAWNASTDEGPSGLAGYKIERADDVDGAPGAFAEIGTTASTAWTDATAGTNTAYWYRVRAYDNAGNNGNYSADTYSAGIGWRTRIDGGEMKRVAYSSALSRYVAVGLGGRILTSSDGQTWTYRKSGTAYDLNAVTWGNSEFVAVGATNTILTSPDGITWTSRTGAGTFNGVTWSGSLYAAVGNSGAISTSPDGVTWTTRASGTTNILYAVTWSGTQFVATGSGNLFTSPDGITWLTRTTGRGNALRDIIWDGAWFVVPGQDGSVYKSGDGINWTYNNFAGSTNFFSVAWDGTTYVVTGVNGVLYTSTDLATWTARPSGTSQSLNGVVWTGTQFVAVGATSTVASSVDGLSWTLRREGAVGFLGAAWSGSKAVAVGAGNAAVFTSADLVNWTDSKISRTIYGVAWSGTQFVEAGAGGVIRTSPDGVAWTSQASGTTVDLNGVTWSGSQLVAVGKAGTILTSPDGVTWTLRTSGTGSDLQAVAWSGPQSRFIATGANGAILSSADGAAWSPVTDPDVSTAFNYLTLYGIIWADNRFIAVGTYGKVYTSPDGATNNWTLVTDADIGTSILYDVAWSGSQFVIVGASGKIFTSPDAAVDSWTLRASGTTTYLYGVVWTGSQFAAVGGSGSFSSTILTSPDGAAWTLRTVGTKMTLYGVAWSGTAFSAVGYYGVNLTSSDGAAWAHSVRGTTLYGAVWSGTQFVAVGAGATAASATILTSPDGVDWVGRSSGTANNITLRGVAWSGAQFAAVGQTGTIVTSADGITWTAQTSGTTNYLYGVAWSGTQFAAVGASGTILTSSDGINWAAQTSGTTSTLWGVAWSGTQFVAVGASGAILTSPDGVAWTARASGTTGTLQGVVWSGTQFVAVGASGVILTSPDGVTWTTRPAPNTVTLYGAVWSPELSRFGVVGASGTVHTSP